MANPPSTFGLSPEQQAVVSDRSGHLQVVACAGSGKTEAISRRAAALINEGVEPAAVIAFTFTERAADALKARISNRVAELKGSAFLDRLGPMFVGTIHSYCLRLLQDHVPEFGNHDVLDEHQLAGLLSREHKRLDLASLGDPHHWRPIADFRRNVDVVENELLDPARLAGTPFGDCYNRYVATLERYHFLTFGQLIVAAVRALENPAIFKRIHSRLSHLIVDEYQDINPAQERLIALLAKLPVHLCVVGDDDQAIYQWRGSDVANILTFVKRYRAQSKPLTVNRRSRPGILAKANAFASTIAPRLDKAMRPHRDPGGLEVHAWAAETVEDEAEKVADTIEALHKRGYHYRDIALLFRSVRTSSPPFVVALRARGIPLRCAGRTGLFLQPEASVLGKLYAWLSGYSWKSERFGQSSPVTLPALVKEFNDVFNGGRAIAELKEYLDDWKAYVADKSSPVNLVRDYYKFLNHLGVDKLDLDEADGSARMGCLARLSQILADYEHVTRRARYVEEDGQRVFRGGQDRGIYYYQRLFNFLQYYALDAYEDFEGEDSFDLEAVDILTVHQAKGLEWPVVFIPSLVDGRFPSRRAGEHQKWLIDEKIFTPKMRRRYEGGETEERRLFYVALTRARDVVYLSRFRRKKNSFAPSPFLLHVAGDDPAPARKIPLAPPFTPSDDAGEELPTSSFSDLARYEDCPRRYRLGTSLGFQPQLATELGYGKAMHHILRRLADHTRALRRLPARADVERLFDDEFYLPFANRAAFEQLIDKARRLVDRYLGDWSQDLLRVWETERPFALHLPQGIVKGRADVILDLEAGTPGALALVDYKTASAADIGGDDVFAFQLAVYAAAGQGEGIDVRAAYLHELSKSTRREVDVRPAAAAKAKARAGTLIDGIVKGHFPSRPEKIKCKACDVRAVCGNAACDKYDF